LADIPDDAIAQGIASLEAILNTGNAAGLLQQTKARSGESVAYRFPLPIDYLGIERTLHIGFPKGFPSGGLNLYVDPSPWLVWPHATKAGLCLHGFKEEPVTGSPDTVVRDSINRLKKILSLSIQGANADKRNLEFQNEITSYWIRQHGRSVRNVLLIGRPESASELFAFSDSRYIVPSGQESVWLSSDIKALGSHARRIMGRQVTLRSPQVGGFFVKLKSFPELEFPEPAELLSWILPHVSEEDATKLSTWFSSSSALISRWLVLELPGKAGAPLYTLNIFARVDTRRRSPIFGSRSAHRKPLAITGQPPAIIYSSRLNVIDRADFYARDLSGSIRGLETAHVVFIGVGSLGGTIASQLARSGLKYLTLIDPDTFESANMGRHVLGMDDLGKFKVDALKTRLMRDHPTSEIKAFNTYVQFALEDKPGLLQSADLVIITTADWESEASLWELKAKGQSWAFIQGWSEPHTLVGHALASPRGDYDGRHLFSDNGDFSHKYTEWPEGGVVPLPACGESFIPGNAMGMSTIATMITQASIQYLNGFKKESLWLTSINRPADAPMQGGTYIGPDLPTGTIQTVLERAWPESTHEAGK
jgi:hypothetical protein